MSLRRTDFLMIILAAAALVLSSCSRRPLYSHFENVDEAGWRRADSLHFVVPVDSAGHYCLRLDLRVNNYYPFTQLLLIARQQVHSSGEVFVDTLHFHITDEEGNVKGRGLSLFQYGCQLSSANLQADDTLSVTVTHGMNRERIEGIVDLGVTAELSEKPLP